MLHEMKREDTLKGNYKVGPPHLQGTESQESRSKVEKR